MLTYDLFQNNVVVVTQQPQVVQPVRYTAGNSDYGTPALVFALVITVFIVLCGCWWSLICSIAGIIFASNVSVINIIFVTGLVQSTYMYLLIPAGVANYWPCILNH